MKIKPQNLLKNLSLHPDTWKTLFLVALSLVSGWLVVDVVMHAWNDFFHAIFGLPEFHFYNALAFLFWIVMVFVMVFVLREDWGK